MLQTKSGNFIQSRPGARRVWTVTMKLRPVRMEENPMTKAPSRMGSTWVGVVEE